MPSGQTLSPNDFRLTFFLILLGPVIMGAYGAQYGLMVSWATPPSLAGFHLCFMLLEPNHYNEAGIFMAMIVCELLCLLGMNTVSSTLFHLCITDFSAVFQPAD